MKLLVMSDNHGQWALVNKLVETHQGQVDGIIHCGDSEFDANDPIWEAFDIVVKGNMDFDSQYPTEATLNTTKGDVWVTHGHLYHIKQNNLDDLRDAGIRQGAKIILHGHTHIAYSHFEDGILMVNPGSLSRSRGPISERTFAIIEWDSEQIRVEFYDHVSNRLDRLTQIYLLGGGR